MRNGQRQRRRDQPAVEPAGRHLDDAGAQRPTSATSRAGDLGRRQPLDRPLGRAVPVEDERDPPAGAGPAAQIVRSPRRCRRGRPAPPRTRWPPRRRAPIGQPNGRDRPPRQRRARARLGLRRRRARAATPRPRSTGAWPPPAAAAHDASRNSCRGAHQVGRPGAHPLGIADHDVGPGRQLVAAPAAGRRPATGASASMPSTASPRLIGSSSSPSSGCSVEQLGRPRLHLGGQQQLPAGRRPQPVLGDLERALVGDLEVADLLDLVAPELHPQRVLLGRREDVEDAAAHREVAAPLDQLEPGRSRRRPGR